MYSNNTLQYKLDFFVGGMMDFLSTFTSVVNFIALAVSVWLGWYILTRSPRRLVSWLTSLTLFSMSGIFLNMLLALNPPPILKDSPLWVQTLFPFWTHEVVFGTGGGWLTGWLATPAIAFWHHATMVLRPGRKNIRHKIQIALVYTTVIVAIVVQISNPYSLTSETSTPLHLATLRPEFDFIIFMSLLFLFACISSANLIASAQVVPSRMARRQFITLAIATIIAGLTGPFSLISVDVLALPRVINTILLGVPVGMIGYSVARYSAMIEGRTIRRDFIYNATAMGLITLIYSAVTWISVMLFDIPAAAFVFVILLAITTHSLIDFSRRYLDIIFYRKEGRLLRRNLRRFARLMGEQDLEETLGFVLDSICDSVRATYGLILLFEEKSHYRAASHEWQKDVSHLPQSIFSADDILQLEPGHYPPPLTEAALLIPLYADTEQLGAMILGPPINSIQYPEADVERLLDASDQVADTIHAARRGEEFLSKAAQMAQSRQIQTIASPEQISGKLVEDILRNIFDYAFLGDSVISELRLIRDRLPEGATTHLDKGKVVYDVIEEAVNKLRPEDEYPGEPVPREWHSFLILYGAYFENKLNRDIMSQLYISEGTFSRTRRSAIRTVARVLVEMETAQH